MSQSKGKRAVKDEGSIKNVTLKILKGSFVGIIMFFALIAILSMMFLKADGPKSALPIAAMIASAVSAFTSGFAAARPRRKNGLTTGAFSSIPMAVVVLTVLLIVNKGDLGLHTVLMLILMLAFSSIGGIVAANKKKKVK